MPPAPLIVREVWYVVCGCIYVYLYTPPYLNSPVVTPVVITVVAWPLMDAWNLP